MTKLDSIVRQHLVFSEEPIRQATKQNHFFQQDSIAIIDELDVEYGKARIDMAIIGSCLHGVEFKSDGDTLNRLYHQIHCYNSAFEKLTLIVGYSHLYEAIEIVPKWWGIEVVEQTLSGCVFFEQVRKSKNNPSLCPHSVLSLLNRYEIQNLAKENGLRISKTAPLNQITESLTNKLRIDRIADLVRTILINRYLPSPASAI